MSRRVVALVALLLLLPNVALAADPPTPPEHDLAFRSGLDQYAHGNFVAAITTWESLLRTMGEDRGYKVLYNLGLAYQAIGDVTRAVERYVAFVTQVAKRKPVATELEDRAGDAQKRVDQIKATYGAVHVLAPKRGGLVLTKVGMGEPRAAGYVVYLAPGTHVIEIALGTDRARKTAIEVEAGKSVEVDTSPAEEPVPPFTSLTEPPQPKPAPAPVEQRNSGWLFWGGIGALASLAVPISFGIVAANKRSDTEALGAGHPDYEHDKDSYERLRTIMYATYALPLVVAAFSVSAWYFSADIPSTGRMTSIRLGPGSASFAGTF